MSVRTAIIGATGYTGRELAALLCGHEHAELVGLFASSGRTESVAFSEEFPRYRGVIDTPIEPLDLDALLEREPHTVFLATPHQASHDLALRLLGKRAPGAVESVVDLSGAFRIPDAQTVERWYGFTPQDAALLDSAVYGLVEHARDQLHGAPLIAAPGCYPTATLLGLVPLLRAGLLDAAAPVSVMGISGVSGAGRSAGVDRLFSEVALKTYAMAGHRHQPEIHHHLGAARVCFTPHVGPWDRGLITTSHAQLASGVSAEEISEALRAAYEGAAFVRVLSDGQAPNVASVAHTNFCDIAAIVDDATGVITVSAAIDNLLKGASGQAVQAWNVRMGWDEAVGLSPLPRAEVSL